MSSTERVVRSSVPVAVGTALSRLTGMARLAALAYALGFDRLADSYNLANTTPNIVYELLLGGVLSATLVPIFVEQREKGDDEATSAVVSVVGLALVLLTGLGIIVAPAVVRLYTLRLSHATAAAQQQVATDLLRMFMPQMLFYGITAVATALLNARRRFAAPAVTPVFNNVLVTAIFLALPHLARSRLTLEGVQHDPGTLLLLGLGTTAGVAVMALPLLPAVRRAGIRLRPVFNFRHPAVRKVIRLSGWTAGYVATNQIALWIVLVLANGTKGGISIYQGAYVFQQLPHGLVAVSLMTTITPELAETVSRGDFAGFRRNFALGLRLMTLVILPAAAGYVVLARPVVALLLQRGMLTPGEAGVTAACVALFALGLLPFSVYLYALRGFYALHDTRTPFVLNCWENLINVVVAVALYPWFGVQGLAFSFSIAYAVAAVMALRSLSRRTGGLGLDLKSRQVLVRTVVAALVMTGAVRLTVVALPGQAPAIVEATVGVLVGVVVYGAALSAMRVREMAEIMKRLRTRLAG
ncbi:MAG TPA: murein biosynthesis integral membrane protein MurJ [Acidimicrobiia bacterium]|nr:murein biosynthesis integral membrane protein MurJ [Acidimicrobiia bacterium]